MTGQSIDKRILEERANTYFENLTPQETSGWQYTGQCCFDIERDVIVGHFEMEWGGEMLPRTKVIDPEQFIG